MSSNLQIEVCPETGICSIIRPNTAKIDLMPDEVASISDEAENLQAVRAVIAESDAQFAAALSQDDLAHIGQRLA